MAQTQIISDNNCGDPYYTDKTLIILDGVSRSVQVNDDAAVVTYDTAGVSDPYATSEDGKTHVEYGTSGEVVASHLSSGMYPANFFGTGL